MRATNRDIFPIILAAILCGCCNSERDLSLRVLKIDDNPIAEEILAASINAERRPIPSGSSTSDIEQILRVNYPAFKFREIQQRGNILFFCFDVGGTRAFEPGSPANILNSVVVDLEEMKYSVFCMAKL